jgi:hypothetical protein
MLALYIIAGIILLLILMLCIPVEIVFDLEIPGEAKSRVRVGWLFGLVWKEIGRGRKKAKRKRKRSLKPFLSLLRTRGLPGKLLKLARQILSHLKVRQLEAELRVGLDDPVATGVLCSLMWPALVSLNSSGPLRVRIEPSFAEPALEASVHGRTRLFPIEMVGPLLGFALSPAGLRATRLMVVSRWRKRRSGSERKLQSGR